MASTLSPMPAPAIDFGRIFAWRRLRTTLVAALAVGFLLGIESPTPMWQWLLRAVVVALAALAGFGLVEHWPRRLPRWLERWALQLIVMVAVVPPAAVAAYWITVGGDPQFGATPMRARGLTQLSFAGIVFGLWIALGAMVRAREAQARDQALAFELERSELARQALDARMRLLQAQVQPHFLFNTLANVQALVQAGSPQAPRVLASLIAYLRAAVPQLDERDATLGQELALVRAYLELMQMRMPDRLQIGVHADPGVERLRCPPMTLLTLVENAVRHGIDPAEDGGRIDVAVTLADGRCTLRVADTGVGLRGAGDGLGTGLATLRERLQLAFGPAAQLRVSAQAPRGVVAEVVFPAQAAA